jgi:hypothetical protein
MRTRVILAASALLLAACGGGTSGTPLAAPVSAADSLSRDSTAKAAANTKRKLANGPHHVFDTVAAGGSRPLTRETYQYQSASTRDPFKPFVEQVEHGPELVDLRLVALLYDANDPSGSIATFRDIGDDHRFTVVPGQHIGRLSVVSVTANTVKLRMDDFGTVREQIYSMRKPEDQKP